MGVFVAIVLYFGLAILVGKLLALAGRDDEVIGVPPEGAPPSARSAAGVLAPPTLVVHTDNHQPRKPIVTLSKKAPRSEPKAPVA